MKSTGRGSGNWGILQERPWKLLSFLVRAVLSLKFQDK